MLFFLVKYDIIGRLKRGISMDLKKDKYIIVEIIPTALSPKKGDIVQLSAIKLEGLQLLDRFDYRLREDLIALEDFKKMIDYDKDAFKYANETKEILNDFKKWSDGLPLLILDNTYTNNFLESLDNKKESICKYLGMDYHDRVIEELIEKFDIPETNYIVDILYESLIKHL